MIEYEVQLDAGNGFFITAKAYGVRVFEAIESLIVAARTIRGGGSNNG